MAEDDKIILVPPSLNFQDQDESVSNYNHTESNHKVVKLEHYTSDSQSMLNTVNDATFDSIIELKAKPSTSSKKISRIVSSSS